MLRILPAALFLLGLATPALADEPWFGEADAVDLDADDAVAEAPISAPSEEDRIDLSTVATALEDGVRRMIRDDIDPVEALPIEVAEAPKTTAAELRGLLEGSAAYDARLHAMHVRWVFLSGEKAVAQASAILVPGAITTLLRLEVLPSDAAAVKRMPMPGGLGVSWGQAEQRLTRLLMDKRCDALPMVDDTTLSTLVPAAYLGPTKAHRNQVPAGRTALCALLAQNPWDRLEMRPVEMHFNLFDAEGTMRGGIKLQLDESADAARLAYPLFKKMRD